MKEEMVAVLVIRTASMVTFLIRTVTLRCATTIMRNATIVIRTKFTVTVEIVVPTKLQFSQSRSQNCGTLSVAVMIQVESLNGGVLVFFSFRD